MSQFSQKDIDDILRLIDSSRFDEFKLEIGDLKLEVRRRGAFATPSPASPGFVAAPVHAPVSQPAAVTAPVAASGRGSEIPAPLLGTFYHAPKPGAAPFVSVGDKVTADTVIGIIEVMKLMNSVTAGIAGTVTEIIAENGQLVEHGQALLRILPN